MSADPHLIADDTPPETPEWFGVHEELDQKRFIQMQKDIRGIHARLNNMPSKKDTELILTTLDNLKIGYGVVRISGRTILSLGAMAAAGIAIVKFWWVIKMHL